MHTIQWERMGVERFRLTYAKGLDEPGDEQSPLEVMAYNHQRRFDSLHDAPNNIEAGVLREFEARFPYSA